MAKTKLSILLIFLSALFLLSLTCSLASYETSRDPQKDYQECQKRCDQQEWGHHQQCIARCEAKRREQEREKERHEHGRGGRHDYNPRRWGEREEEQEQQQEQEQEKNPYLFTKQHFNTRVRTEHGFVSVLQRFTQRSKLLRGIENYRFGILEANPNTFVTPHHIDADAVFVVLTGRGSISLVNQNSRENYNLQQGDVLRIRSGSVVYLINKDNSEKLYIAKLLQPSSTPGQVEAFFGTGGEDPESFYSTFSNEILEAAFNTPWDRLQKLFGQQKKGAIIKASQEQIRALSPQTRWPFGGGESGGPYNLLHHRPLHSNQYGQLFQVNPNDYSQLQDLDVAVAFANLSSGAMAGPTYNTRSTKIAMVVDGNGYFEMACPHVSSSGRSERGGGSPQQRERGGVYQKINARVSRGDVFVVPTAHPFVIVASRDENLQVICFEINARGNEKNWLVGRDSVINQIEREAKELAFNVPAREVEEIFNNQKQSFFYPGPHQQKGGRHAVA